MEELHTNPENLTKIMQGTPPKFCKMSFGEHHPWIYGVKFGVEESANSWTPNFIPIRATCRPCWAKNSPPS